MTLHVISSSSRGNSYALQSDTETLFIEAGIRLSSVKKSLNYDLRTPVGCICSHSHGDHFKYAADFEKLCPIYAPAQAINHAKLGCGMGVQPVKEGNTFTVGAFRITPFEVYHDVPCFGYVIYHKQMGTMLFATDTFALPYEFQNINHWLIEANYDDAILTGNLNQGKIDRKQYNRVLTSHMSLQNCISNLRQGNAENAHTITLIHLSSRHSHPDGFQDKVAAEFGCPTYIATKGVKVNLTKL